MMGEQLDEDDFPGEDFDDDGAAEAANLHIPDSHLLQVQC